MAPHMLPSTWANTAAAMRARISVHPSLTSSVAKTNTVARAEPHQQNKKNNK